MGRIAIITMLLSTVVGCNPFEKKDDPVQECDCPREGDDYRMALLYNSCVAAYPGDERECFTNSCGLACPIQIFDSADWDFK